MRKNWVWLLVTGCFLLVLVLAGVGLSTAPRPIAPPQRMPDGSLAIPLGFTVGDTKHRWVEGNALQQTLGRVLPPNVAAGLGAQVHEYTTPNATTPVLWMRYLGRKPNSTYWPGGWIIADSDGCETGAGTRYIGSGSEGLEAISLTQFNRRDPEIRLRFFTYASHGRRQDAEFKLRNPVLSTAASWIPQPLPASATDGPLTVTLDEVITRCDMSKPPRLAGGNQNPCTWFRVHTTENGKRSENWNITNLEFGDATGNAGFSNDSSNGVRNGEIWYYLGMPLCPIEPAWKVRLEMSRRAGFAPGELWTLQNIPVPAAKERTTIGQQCVLQGVTLKCLDFVGDQAPLKGGFRMMGAYWLQLKVIGLHPGLRLMLASATDQLDRKVQTAGSNYDSAGNFGFGLRPAPGARSLTVTLAVTRSRYVEFLTRTALPTGSAPAR